MNVPFTAYMQATAACTWFMVVNNVYIGQAAGDLTDLVRCLCVCARAHARTCCLYTPFFLPACRSRRHVPAHLLEKEEEEAGRRGALCICCLVRLALNVKKTQMSGKSSGGIADYAKIALPLVGTVVLCDWIRRFMKSLTAKGTPKKPGSTKGDAMTRKMAGNGGRDLRRRGCMLARSEC